MFSLRQLARPVVSRVATRSLSAEANTAMEKLQSVLETYRLANYQQETKFRFRSEVTKVALVQDDLVGVVGVEKLLANIGEPDAVEKADLNLIFSEMGQGGQMPASRFAQMI